MIIGVIGFYFIISALNAYISDSMNKRAELSMKIYNLKELKQKYRLSDDTYQIGINSLAQNDIAKDKSNFTMMLEKFPKSLKRELKYQMYLSILKNFEFIKTLKMKLVIAIGESLQKVRIKESKGINIIY
jgi:hypothetical protein